QVPATCLKICDASCGIWAYCSWRSQPCRCQRSWGSRMVNALLLPLMAYAAVGLVLSLVVHLLSFMGTQAGGMGLFVAPPVGIFRLGLPVVLLANKMSGGARRKDLWKAALSGCPSLDEVHDLRLLHLRIREFRTLPCDGTDRQAERRRPASFGLAR